MLKRFAAAFLLAALAGAASSLPARAQADLRTAIANVWKPQQSLGPDGRMQTGAAAQWVLRPSGRGNDIFAVFTPQGQPLWADGKGLHVGGNMPKDMNLWRFEEGTVGKGFKLLRHLGTQGYLNIEHGEAAVGPINDGWWSAQWALLAVPPPDVDPDVWRAQFARWTDGVGIVAPVQQQARTALAPPTGLPSPTDPRTLRTTIANLWKPSQFISGQGTIGAQATTLAVEPAYPMDRHGAGRFVRITPAPGSATCLYTDGGAVTMKFAKPGDLGCLWEVEIGENRQYQFVSIRTGGYLNIEHGGLAAGPIQPGWWSARWVLSSDTPPPPQAVDNSSRLVALPTSSPAANDPRRMTVAIANLWKGSYIGSNGQLQPQPAKWELAPVYPLDNQSLERVFYLVEKSQNVKLYVNAGGVLGLGTSFDEPRTAYWELEPVENASGQYRLRNLWTGGYLNNERGPLAVGDIQPGWWSARWTLK